MIAAVDNGTPAQFSSLRLLGVVLADDEDNAPRFPQSRYTLSIPENQPAGRIVGKQLLQLRFAKVVVTKLRALSRLCHEYQLMLK